MSTENQSTRLMQAVADALTILLEPGSFALATTRFLDSLGSAVGADRAYYFENDAGSNPRTCSQRCEWAREGISHELHNPRLRNLNCDSVLPGWQDAVSARKPACVLTRDTESPLYEILAARQILLISKHCSSAPGGKSSRSQERAAMEIGRAGILACGSSGLGQRGDASQNGGLDGRPRR